MPHKPVTKFMGMRTVPSAVNFLSISPSRGNMRERGNDARKHIVDLVVRVGHFDGDLSEVVGVRTRQNLFVVVQVLRHCNQVVLDIGEIETLKVSLVLDSVNEDVRYLIWGRRTTARCLLSVRMLTYDSVARTSLGETLHNICLVTH